MAPTAPRPPGIPEPVLGVDAPEVLDPGPLPTVGHDGRRSNRNIKFSGPSQPTVRAVYAAALPGDYTRMAVLSDGTVLIGTCGSVRAIDASGHELWRQSLARRGYNEERARFAVDASGRIYFSTGECPDTVDSIRLGACSVLPTGEIYWHRQHSAATG